ncbi:type II secretion system F family protein [Cohnella lupini]|uniref:Type II secretion system protein F (GspF) n=1 Tax=Cohnella lupini TaxID=1294267 RepID=A0A3D9IMN6_9BACL|nr:type II secretion system F family protein [Cohnella lupini]RED63022.1 type II secretion system protein F (GspF) [Cohnella lupini]
MNIVLVAIAAGAVIWLGLVLLDRRKRKGTDESDIPAKKKSDMVSHGKDNPVKAKLPTGEDLIRYSEYTLSSRERIEAWVVGCALFFALGYLFYNNVLLASVTACLGLLSPRAKRKKLLEKRKTELNFQFKQALYSLSSSLSAGRSVENAFEETVKDLRLLYPDPRTHIIREFEVIIHRIENGEPMESALADFSERSGVEDIENFADVFISCKRTGGDLVEIIRRTSNIIGDKLEIQQEISVMMAQKRFESKALSFAPIIIVAFLTLSSPDYMAPLHSGVGYVIMTAALLVLVGCYWITQRIMNIRV